MKEMNTFQRWLFCLCSLLVLTLIGCGTQSETIAVRRPAEIELTGIKKVVVSNIQPRESRVHAQDFTDALITRLARSNRFEVLDRQNLGVLLREKGLSDSSLSDQSVQLRLFGPSAFISGRVSVDEFRASPVDRLESKDKNGHVTASYQQRGNYNFAVEMRVTDVRTGKIIATKTASGTASGETPWVDYPNVRLDEAPLYRRAMESAADSFMRMVDQHVVQVRVSFQTDRDVPVLEQAIAQFRAGQYGPAIEGLNGALARPGLSTEQQAKVRYDLGLVQIYAGQFVQAEANLKQAYALRADPEYLRALETLATERAQAEKLQQQNRAQEEPSAASRAGAGSTSASSSAPKSGKAANAAPAPAPAPAPAKPKADVKF